MKSRTLRLRPTPSWTARSGSHSQRTSALTTCVPDHKKEQEEEKEAEMAEEQEEEGWSALHVLCGVAQEACRARALQTPWRVERCCASGMLRRRSG